MKQASAALAAYLAARPAQLIAPDLFTFTLISGEQLFYTNADVPVTEGGQIYLASSVRIDGLRYKIATGLDVDEQDVDIAALPTELVQGVPFLEALRRGVFDGATLKRARAFLPAWTAPAIGTVTLFHGRISTITQIGRTHAQLKVKSDLVLLDIDYPRNIYQASCLHTLFDAGCGLAKASFGVAGTVGSDADAVTIPWGSATAGQYHQGTVTFTSGVNQGVSRNVKRSTGSALVLSYPLDTVPAEGDGFTAYPGCDHTTGAGGCAKFANLANFRGFPFVPAVETGI